MTTFLLSQKINTLFGIFISLYVCILTRRLVHPTSPVLLTKNGPLKTIPFCDETQCDPRRPAILSEMPLLYLFKV
jgi:hypothetical protein